MEPLLQLNLLASGMNFEPDGAQGCDPVIGGKRLGEIPITEAVLPNGKRIKLLKTLLSSACERDCYYCPFRAGRDMRRATFKPEELAKLFVALHQAKAVEGLFLSSGLVGGGLRTQDKLLDTAEILRKKYHYRGYLHLKIMPGAEKAQVERAMHLASRISVNLEAPNDKRLQLLAPRKEFAAELLQPLLWAEEIRAGQSPHRTWNGRWPSTTTQFVVGAVGETDVELLATSEFLYRKAGLQRAYFSRFKPVSDTPFEHLPEESPQRENRLYQSSFLLRDYGFSLEELPFDASGSLPRHLDPKLAWAQAHLTERPIDLARAPREQLLRVPGIGPKSADTLLEHRRTHTLRELSDLQKMGIQAQRAAPFILLNGQSPTRQLQFALFSPAPFSPSP